MSLELSAPWLHPPAWTGPRPQLRAAPPAALCLAVAEAGTCVGYFQWALKIPLSFYTLHQPELWILYCCFTLFLFQCKSEVVWRQYLDASLHAQVFTKHLFETGTRHSYISNAPYRKKKSWVSGFSLRLSLESNSNVIPLKRKKARERAESRMWETNMTEKNTCQVYRWARFSCFVLQVQLMLCPERNSKRHGNERV